MGHRTDFGVLQPLKKPVRRRSGFFLDDARKLYVHLCEEAVPGG